MSTNDILTAVLAVAALAAVAATLLGFRISNGIDRRAARSALTELTIQVSTKAAKYAKLTDGDAKYLRALELEVLLREADGLADRLGNRFPESVGITLAQALEEMVDYWWADRYWEKAATTDDLCFRAQTISYWAIAVWKRGERQRAWIMTTQALESLAEQSSNAHIVRGSICVGFASWVKAAETDKLKGLNDTQIAHGASYWFSLAEEEFQQIPAATNLWHDIGLDWVQDARGTLATPAIVPSGPKRVDWNEVQLEKPDSP
jgi:hypothetical protein